MAYNALKSLDLTNLVNFLIWFPVSCSNREGQVSPVWTVAFCGILLSSSSCVQFKKIMLMGLCVSFVMCGCVCVCGGGFVMCGCVCVRFVMCSCVYV